MFGRVAIILLFALIASPFLFKSVAGVLGNWVASTNSGMPTPAGLLLHGLVFLLLSGFVMRTMKSSYRNYQEPEMYATEDMYAEEEYAEGDEGYAEGDEGYAEGDEGYGEEEYAEGDEGYAAEELYAEDMYAEEPYEDYRN
jgi:hypothetical protein